MARGKLTKITPPVKLSSYKPLIICALVMAVLTLGYYFVVIPFKQRLALGYIEQGDRHLLQREFIYAVLDYKKSLWLDKQAGAEAKIDFTDRVQLDYLALKPLLAAKDALPTELARAEAVPQSSSDGADLIENYIKNDQSYLAEIVAQTLIEMDSQSQNAWLYLGISRLQTGRTAQMTADSRRQKLASAKEAFITAKELDKSNALAIKYLEEINKML